MIEPICVDVTGTYRNQGRQHGEALAGTIKEIIAEIVPWSQWDEARVDGMLGTVEANLRRFTPGIIEEMHGIAEGSGLTYREILAYNALVDVSMMHQWCTAVAWADSPEGPVVGKTNDIGQHHEKYHQMYRRRSGEGLPALWFSWPGTAWGGCFVNSGGVASGGASLGMNARHPDGIPCNCMLRVLADEAETLEAFLGCLDRVPVMHHPQHNVCSWAGGQTVAIEITPEGPHVCQSADEPFVAVTNHFCDGPFVGRDTGEQRHQDNSRRRLANLRHLAATVEPGVEGMKRILTDHAESGGICQHGADDMWSSSAFIMLPRDRRMLVAQGQPCENEWVELVL